MTSYADSGLSFCTQKEETWRPTTKQVEDIRLSEPFKCLRFVAEETHWISMSGCLSDTLARGIRVIGTLAAPSPTRPMGLFNTGRKSSAQTHTDIQHLRHTHKACVFSSSCLFSMNVCLMFKYFLFDLYLYTLLYSLIKTLCLIYKSDLCQTNIKIAAIEETIE